MSLRLPKSSGFAVAALFAGTAWYGWVATAGIPAGEDLEMGSSTIDGGGGTSTGGVFELSGTFGQPDAGAEMTGGDFALTGGFWPAAAFGETVRGDCDGDQDVDLVDFGDFQLCFTGSTGILTAGCECADFDGDSDVDLVDFGAFQLAFSGSTGS